MYIHITQGKGSYCSVLYMRGGFHRLVCDLINIPVYKAQIVHPLPSIDLG